MVRKLLLAAAAAALAALPTTGHTAALDQRVPAEVSDQDDQLAGLVWQYVLLPVLLGLLLAALGGGDDDEVPASP